MTPTEVAEIVCAHSADSDDAYMFYALATCKLRSPMLNLRHVLDDIQILNEKALRGEFELSTISYHAYPYVADRYLLMPAGACVGDGFGPSVVAQHPLSAAGLKGKRIAVPGKLTTAYLTLRLMQPDFEAVVVPFDKVLDTVREGTADAALVIHEVALMHGRAGFHPVVDLGRWWKDTTGLPLPLACNVIRRDLDTEVRGEASRLMRESIEYALDHREEALNYALQFARDMDSSLTEKFVGMYVNQYSLDCGEAVTHAAQTLLDMGHDAGIIPNRVALEYER